MSSILHSETHPALDLSAGEVVLSFLYELPSPKSVLCRITVGSVSSPIAGGGEYVVRAAINGIDVSPVSNVTVEAGVTITVLQSREILIQEDDDIEIAVDGLPADTAVDVSAVLVDMTPATINEIFGDGGILVDHDYGGDDELRIATAGGAGIQDVSVLAYLKSDYDAGQRGTAFVRGRATTDVNGRWREPMRLDPETYTLVITKQSYQTTTEEITVTA